MPQDGVDAKGVTVQTNTFYVAMIGGPADAAGVNIAAQDGVGELVPTEDDLQV